MNNSILLLV